MSEKRAKNPKAEEQNKFKWKNKFKCSEMSFIIIHCIIHCIRYIFLFEIGMQSKTVHTPDKSFRKTFGEKEGNIQTRSEFSKKIPTELDLKPFAWHQSCKSNQIDKCDKVKSATRLAVKGKSK